ncbi:MAG: anaerobic glycerol-3-phosphate dehydrogenase subunit C [Rudaea sp.]
MDSIWHSVDPTLDGCIKCNICTAYCPVSEVTDKFPGPKYVGPQAARFRERLQSDSPDIWVDYCSACRTCNDVCPAGVKIAELNARAKAQIVKDRGLPLRNWFFGRNEQLGKIGDLAPQLANLGFHNPVSRLLAEKVMGVARNAPIPHWSTEGTFRGWMKRTRKQRLRSDKKVAYFHGCSTNYYEPWVGKAAVAVLEHNGFEVLVPDQNCCGLPMINNGEFPAAGKLYQNNIKKLTPFVEMGVPIVGTSISCTLVLQEEAAEMLDIDDAPSRRLREGMWDLFEWFREREAEAELKKDFRDMPLILPYHASCQLKAHRIGRPAVEIMSLIPGVDLREGHSRCCGLAGTYGYKAEKYDIAMKVGREAFQFIEDQGDEVEYVASDSEICRWQLTHGTNKPTRHPVEILAAAYGLYDLEKRKLLSEIK